ncbi:choice-of-anchor D domain-containing protein [Formosa sp. 3Alg 14/1]|uniref:choice-of-anchor D domain-containing protein n=1 Tax=Formosa sp. 3Alg 14/1 TaxID=3382190 RepID=UPI0039BE7A10
MKLSYTTTIVLFLSVISLGFSQCLSDNFNTNYGNWTESDTYRLPIAGNEGDGVGFNNTNDFIVTSVAVTNPESIQFNLAKSSVSDQRTLSIQYSTTTSGPWIETDNITVGQTTETHQLFSFNLNLTGDYYIRVIMTQRSGGSYYLDDISIFCSGANAPEIQLLDEFGNLQNCGFSIDFGSIAVNATTQKTVIIKNTGDINLIISSLTLPSNISVTTPTFPVSISPNTETLLTIAFNPITSGNSNDTLHILNSDSNESDCTILLTGHAFAPAPEIDVERNTDASIPNGSESSTGYNTVFASTIVGETTASKLYYIHNEGQLDLLVSDITSSNPTEFQITVNPSHSTISSQTKMPFEIQFSPSSSGIRTSTISITNNDADEDPYTFEVQGTGKCSSAPLLAQPSSGPPGTIVTITDSNFGTATTANLNGIVAEINIISDTKMEVKIPPNATSGTLSITNDLGCSNATNFNLIALKAIDCDGNNANTPTNLFISEITDHPSGSHSYIEIYNGTGSAVDMEDYSIEIHYNGSTIQDIMFEEATLNNQDVFVVAFGAGDAENSNATHGYDHVSTLVGINNNDNIRLLHNDNWIDLWGNTSGSPFTISQKGYTYRRKNNIQNAPSTTWNQNDWEAFHTVDYTDIGTYNYYSGIPPSILTQPTNNSLGCSLYVEFSTVAEEGFIGQKQLQYQWYYNPPESDIWTEVIDDLNHDDPQTSTLKILNTIETNGNQYYCRILEDSNLCYTATATVKVSVKESIWTNTGWQNNIEPNVNSFTVIDYDYNTVTNGNITTCGLYIPLGKSLVIDTESYVKVINKLHVEGELIVKNKGSFVQEDDSEIINSGVITVEKETAVLNAWYEYTYWSAPVANETFDPVFNNSQRLYWYNASNFVDIYKEENNNNAQVLGQDNVDDNANDWQAIEDNTDIKRTDNLIPGVAYAATHSELNFTPGTKYTYSFSGNFNNGTILTAVARNDESHLDTNFNLIGNPYPSAIDVTAFFQANVHSINANGTLEGAIYLWSHDTPPSDTFNGNDVYNFSPSDYAIINGSGSIAAQEGSGTKPDNFIPSCQGFFIQFSDNYPTSTGHVVFNNAMRVTDKSTQFFRTSKSNKLWINLTSDNGVFSQTLVSYISGAKDEYDGSFYDVDTYISKDVTAKLYTTMPNTDKAFSIQGKALQSINRDEKINLGLHLSIKVPTIYKLSLDDFEGEFISQNELFLEDTFLNTYHDLKSSPYTFTSKPGTFNNRFNITFKAPTLNLETVDNTSSQFEIIHLPTNNIIFNLESDHIKMHTIEIFNMLGQKIHHIKPQTNRNIFNVISLNQGTYIAAVSCNNSVYFKRKFIKK